jgi:hypothetical protein
VCDNDIEQLSQHLPKLRSLAISSRDRPTSAPSLTLNALLGVVKNCPRIDDIDLVIDARRVPSLDTTTASRLSALDCGHSIFGDPIKTAAFLNSLFLRLSKFYAYRWMESLEEMFVEDGRMSSICYQGYQTKEIVRIEVVE